MSCFFSWQSSASRGKKNLNQTEISEQPLSCIAMELCADIHRSPENEDDWLVIPLTLHRAQTWGWGLAVSCCETVYFGLKFVLIPPVVPPVQGIHPFY